MSQSFLAEIKMFGGNFAPKGFAFCNGQLLALSQNTALFSLLGTNYGGDGRTNFGLPNLQGLAPIQQGQGPGFSPYTLGQTGGTSTVTVTSSQIPSHNHSPNCLSTLPNPSPQLSPSGNVWAVAGTRRAATTLYKASPFGTAVPMNPAALANSGGSQPHNNMQPYLALTFIIALQGIYPARS